MKQDTSFAVLMGVIYTLVVIMGTSLYFIMNPEQYVDLPEEISLAKPGDTLYIIKNNPDTLELGFRK